VMGTHGRSGISRVLLGSVAQRVVQHARCPVLIVPWRGRHGAGKTAT
jgi:nucleotide-binding universal stress UspA family protein